MKVIVVDDDRNFARDLSESLRSEGHDSLVFHSVGEARAGLAAVEEPFLVLLDHDFGSAEPGYELCRWLRENHPFGLLLPIVYLTGRESAVHFLEHQADSPFVHPSAFVAKNQLAQDDAFLPRLLKRYEEQFEQGRILSEKQSVRQALHEFATMNPEDVLDAP